jgi:uncharacterized damage-inducible protein DinB
MGSAAAAAPLALGAEKSLESIMARANAARAFTMLVASAMPAASYEVMVHIGQAQVFYVGRLSKTAVPDEMKAPKVAEKEAAQKYLAATFDYCDAALAALAPADLDKMFAGRPNTPSMSGWDLVLNSFIHTSHHRGYADVYLRMKGITPPTYSV